MLITQYFMSHGFRFFPLTVSFAGIQMLFFLDRENTELAQNNAVSPARNRARGVLNFIPSQVKLLEKERHFYNTATPYVLAVCFSIQPKSSEIAANEGSKIQRNMNTRQRCICLGNAAVAARYWSSTWPQKGTKGSRHLQ